MEGVDVAACGLAEEGELLEGEWSVLPDGACGHGGAELVLTGGEGEAFGCFLCLFAEGFLNFVLAVGEAGGDVRVALAEADDVLGDGGLVLEEEGAFVEDVCGGGVVHGDASAE